MEKCLRIIFLDIFRKSRYIKEKFSEFISAINRDLAGNKVRMNCPYSTGPTFGGYCT